MRILLAALLLSGCVHLKHDRYSKNPTIDREPRECRLLYRSDWSRTWLECRTCYTMGKYVECPEGAP